MNNIKNIKTNDTSYFIDIKIYLPQMMGSE